MIIVNLNHLNVLSVGELVSADRERSWEKDVEGEYVVNAVYTCM
jgi:hypothetical protein